MFSNRATSNFVTCVLNLNNGHEYQLFQTIVMPRSRQPDGREGAVKLRHRESGEQIVSGFGCNMRRISGRGAGQADEDKRHQNRKDLSLGDQTGNIEASFSKVS